ncbi:MAG: hypothetical protein LBU06_08595 [Desulfovibrio sp.]|nr:hypothetical protein [Desulfovibrio sp.]
MPIREKAMDDTRLTLSEAKRKKKVPRILFIALVLLLALSVGAAFRHFIQKRGRIEPAQNLIPHVPGEGPVPGLRVKSGDEAEQGKGPLRPDNAHTRSALSGERSGPESPAAPVQTHFDEEDAALALREEQLRLLEDEARRRVQEASEREARAGVEYTGALARQNREKNQTEKRSLLEKNLLEARRDLAQARREFETMSRKRAELSTEIRNRGKQRQNGNALLPASGALPRAPEGEISGSGSRP